jgi:RNA polymerase sigma factor (sigma-70 family)
MSSNETTAGCETVLTAMPGEPVSFDEGRDTAQSALHRYIECVLPNLRRYARSLTHDAVDADDLLQECLARALGKLQLWKAGTDLRAWLFSILHNEYVTQIRRAARQGTAVDWSEFESGLSAWPDRALGNTRPGTSAEIAARRATHGGPDDQFDKRLLRRRVGVQSPRRHHTISPFARPEDPPRANERGPFGAARRQPLPEGQLKAPRTSLCGLGR